MIVLDFHSARASALRHKLRNPPNAVPDRGINIRNGHPVPPPGTFRSYSPPSLAPRKWEPIVPHLMMLNIVRIVAAEYGVDANRVMSSAKHGPLLRPRAVAMWLCRKLTRHTFHEIGMRFGNKNHSTVLDACNRIDRKRQADAELNAKLDHFIAALSPMGAA